MPATSRLLTTLMILSVLVTVLIPEPSLARPSGIVSRRKRVSDQRLAELETLLGLSKIKGIVITVPVAFGVVDPAKIGRKRRSISDDTFDNLREIADTDEGNLIFQPEEEYEIRSPPLKDSNDRPENKKQYELV